MHKLPGYRTLGDLRRIERDEAVAAPKLASMENLNNSITFTWTKPAGSSRYRVYKKIDGTWKKLQH